LKEEMRLVELRLTNEQQNNIKKKDEYAKMHTKVSHLQNQVITLSNQLRQAKQSSMNAQLVDHVNCQAAQRKKN
jgi:uncharacterized protein YlxW (UPF0749 family)